MSEKFLPKPVSFLVCFAVREEVAVPSLPAERLITGMGRRNASTRFQEALRRLNPERVLTCGFAGALNPEFKIGDVLFDEDIDAGMGKALLSARAIPAKFYCSARVAVTAAEKAELWRTTGADAVEMESSVIRALCRERGIPSATVRVISDAANDDLALDFNALMTSEQKISIPKLMMKLAASPRSIPKLMQLQRNTRFAARRLGDVLSALLHSLRDSGA
jgi:adenosylhomocysteine nucleosidase